MPRPKLENNTTLLPSQEEFRVALRQEVQDAVRAVIESVMQDELKAVVQAAPYEHSSQRTGHWNGSSTRDLISVSGVLTDVRVPRDRAGRYQTQVFERFQRYEPASQPSDRRDVFCGRQPGARGGSHSTLAGRDA